MTDERHRIIPPVPEQVDPPGKPNQFPIQKPPQTDP